MNKILSFLLLLTCGTAYGQMFVGTSGLESRKAKGITVVEFWAPFNEANELSFLNDLDDCKSFRLCIEKHPEATSEYNVLSIPTVVVFDNGVEVLRYNPNILMKLVATQEEIQSDIDEIILKKFQ